MKVVVFKLNSLGDNVVFVPVIQELRSRFPDWNITLISSPRESELYGGRLAPSEMVICKKAKFNKAYRRPWELALWTWRIRRMRPDACLIAFDQSNVAHFVAKFSGARVRVGGNLVRIKLRNSLTENIPLPEDLRPVTWNWRMARALARTFDRDVEWPDTPPPPDLEHLFPEGRMQSSDRIRVVVHTGAGQDLNKWSPDRFGAVARALARDFEVVWINHGGTTGQAPDGVKAVTANSISELARWLASADLFLGNNSGPMHLANALGCNGVAVTGPTTTGWDPYWHRERWTILRHPDLKCSPCEITSVALERCINIESPMACLNYWTADRVEAACRKRLSLIGKPAL
jgi:ADP-heptose:LPS heptosyltransferase